MAPGYLHPIGTDSFTDALQKALDTHFERFGSNASVAYIHPVTEKKFAEEVVKTRVTVITNNAVLPNYIWIGKTILQ